MHLIRCVRLESSYTFRSHIVYIYGENYGHTSSLSVLQTLRLKEATGVAPRLTYKRKPTHGNANPKVKKVTYASTSLDTSSHLSKLEHASY